MFGALLGSVREWQGRREAMRELRKLQRLDNELLELSDNNPLHRAKMALEMDAPDEALRFWREACEKYPDATQTSNDSVRILLKLKLFDEAEALTRVRMKAYPREPRHIEEFAEVADVKGDLEEAAQRWKLVQKKFPQRPASYVYGAGCLRRLGKIEEADALIKKGLALFPTDTATILEYGRLGDDLGDLPEALRRWEMLVPLHPSGWISAARTLQKMGRIEEADAKLRAGRQRYPIEPGIAVAMAELAQERGDLEEALKRWATVRERFPLAPAGYVEGGRLLKRLQRFPEADQVLEAAIHRFPKQEWPFVDYSLLAHEQGNWEEAARRWETVRQEFPNRQDGYTFGADALARLGRDAEAAELRAEFHRQTPRAG